MATQSELHQGAQRYNAQLQEYNGKLQADLNAASEQLKQLQVIFHCVTILPEALTPFDMQTSISKQSGTMT